MSKRHVEEFSRHLDIDDDELFRYSDYPGVVKRHEAAVLMPFLQQDGAWHVLFIVRSNNERDHHGGQVAFPGGRVEPQDENLVQTALRETEEEIGMSADGIDVLNELPSYTTISGYEVTPVAAVVNWPQTLTLQSDEVQRVFTIPLEWLADRNNVSLRARPDVDRQTAHKHPVVVFEPFDGEVLWGATARMVLHGLKALNDGRIQLPHKA